MDDPGFRLEYPWLLLLALLPLAIWLLRTARAGAGFAPFSLAAANLRASRGPLVHRLLVVVALALLVLAAARPQFGRSIEINSQEGRSIMLVIDLSGSMQLDDLRDDEGERKDRLDAVMEAASAFIAGRPNDRIGLVVFSDRAMTSCPLTYDHQTLGTFLKDIETQQRYLWSKKANLVGEYTNIGLGLGTALRRLKRHDDKAGRAIVLITDGKDTRELDNWVDPVEAARHARESDVRIHAIGVGNPNGTFTQPDILGRVREYRLRQNMLPDIQRLRAIAETSGGIAFSAGDQNELDKVFTQIDRLETSPQEIRRRDDFSDRFLLPLLLGSLLLACATLAEPRLRGGL